MGSPAHAGIDLVITESGAEPLRFPRTRGDRPRVPIPPILGLGVPPHTRG